MLQIQSNTSKQWSILYINHNLLAAKAEIGFKNVVC